MKIKYDKQSDSIYFIVSDNKPYESEEIEKDIVIDFDKDNNIVAIEVLNFNKNHKNFQLPIDGTFSLKKAS